MEIQKIRTEVQPLAEAEQQFRASLACGPNLAAYYYRTHQ